MINRINLSHLSLEKLFILLPKKIYFNNCVCTFVLHKTRQGRFIASYSGKGCSIKTHVKLSIRDVIENILVKLVNGGFINEEKFLNQLQNG